VAAAEAGEAAGGTGIAAFEASSFLEQAAIAANATHAIAQVFLMGTPSQSIRSAQAHGPPPVILSSCPQQATSQRVLAYTAIALS
jgi:hypothetical protein